jgi:hypothetical protein
VIWRGAAASAPFLPPLPVTRGRAKRYRLEAGGWRLEAGGWRLEAGGWRLEAGGWRLEGEGQE